MKILVFDTALNKTYVTLSENGKLLTSKIVENKDEKYHSAFLISTIVEILKKFGIKVQDIDVFGVNTGPGSFTGIRACVTVARVFAQQTEKPLIGVSSLEILSKINKTGKDTVVLMDARRGQVYFAQYNAKGKEISEPQLILIEDIDSLPLKNSFVIADKFVKNMLDEKNIESVDYNIAGDDLGIYLSQIVFEKAGTGNKYFWGEVKPLYLQTPPVSCKSAGLK